MSPLALRQVPLIDLASQHAELRGEILAAMERVLDSGRFILGPEVKQLETEIAALSGTAHAIACASGSDALLLALLAAGVTHGSRVLTTPFSFFATAGSITLAGATPVFVDIEPATFNLDAILLEQALRNLPGARAIIPVHLYGGCANMDPILELAAAHGSVVIEDGAQSIGATYKGRPAQGIGHIGCLSFFPTKNLGALGDAGMLTTSDGDLAARLASLAVHGSSRRYYHDYVGMNSRLDTLQAAVLLVKLRRLEEWTNGRIANAAMYRSLLDGSPVVTPAQATYQTRHIYNQFVIRAPRRDELMAHLKSHGVSAEIYYPVPLHLQRCYQDLGYREGDFPHSEQAAREVLALPIHSGLSREDIEYVSAQIRAFYA